MGIFLIVSKTKNEMIAAEINKYPGLNSLAVRLIIHEAIKGTNPPKTPTVRL
jgi:hypothetical protein